MSLPDAAANLELTNRQEAILSALLRRTPIKQIAFDQGIAPSTVNDHIKAMKRKFGVETTAQLVAAALNSEHREASPPFKGATKGRVLESSWPAEEIGRGRTDALALSDSMAFVFEAPWVGRQEPRVVPEELDGPRAIVPRLIAIGKAVSLILAVVVLSILALQTVDGLVASGGTSEN